MTALILATVGIVTAGAGFAASTFDSFLPGTRVTLSLPEGTCAFDHSHLYDVQMQAAMKRMNQSKDMLLLAFADCKDLESARAGKPVSTGYYGHVIVPVSLLNPQNDYSRKDIVKDVKNFNLDNGIWHKADPFKKLAALRDNPTVSELPQILGIIEDNADYVSVANLQYKRLPTFEPGDPTMGIETATVIAAPAYVYLYHAGDSDEVLKALKQQSDHYVRKLVKDNTLSIFATITSKMWTIFFSLMGIVALGLYWLSERRKQRRRP